MPEVETEHDPLQVARRLRPSPARVARVRAGRLARWVLDPGVIVARARRSDEGARLVVDDYRDATSPQRTVVIASMPRTGSSLLADRMAATGSLGRPAEFFNGSVMVSSARFGGSPTLTRRARMRQFVLRLRLHKFWEHVPDFEPESVDRYVDELLVRRTGPNGVFSFKIHWDDLEAMKHRHGITMDVFPQPIDWVWVRRNDLLAQAVSNVRALQTNAWNSSQRAARPLEPERYDPLEIERSIGKALLGEDGWASFFRENGIDPIRVEYAELGRDPDATARRVLLELGIDANLTSLPASGLARQRDGVSAEWIERFRRERPDLVAAVEARST